MESDQALSGVYPNNGVMVSHPNSIIVRAKIFEMLADGVFSSLNEGRTRQAWARAILILDTLRSHDREAFRDK
jgi:hypothetical protein